MIAPLESKIERISKLEPGELRAQWESHYGAPAPQISPALLQMGLAWKHQEKAYGGLSKDAQHILRGGDQRPQSRKPTRKLTPGTKLVRDWHGEGHTITVLDEGFEYDGRSWASLSAIAKAITGTHWNGPRFFGLAARSGK